MCFYDQHAFDCGDFKWSHFRQHCDKEYRSGETCGMKLVFSTIQVPSKCRVCQKIEVKQNRIRKEVDRITRLRAKYGNSSLASLQGGEGTISQHSEDLILQLKHEIAQLTVERGYRGYDPRFSSEDQHQPSESGSRRTQVQNGQERSLGPHNSQFSPRDHPRLAIKSPTCSQESISLSCYQQPTETLISVGSGSCYVPDGGRTMYTHREEIGARPMAEAQTTETVIEPRSDNDLTCMTVHNDPLELGDHLLNLSDALKIARFELVFEQGGSSAQPSSTSRILSDAFAAFPSDVEQSQLVNTQEISTPRCALPAFDLGSAKVKSRTAEDFSQSKKRPTDFTDDIADSEVSSVESKRPRKEVGIITNSATELRRFACPYHKHEPVRFGIGTMYHVCAGQGWKDIAKVKEHLYRRHYSLSQCQRCKTTFASQASLDSHTETANSCQARRRELEDGFTLEIFFLLHNKKKSSPRQTEADRWQEIYRLLFPKGVVRSPFNDNDYSDAEPVVLTTENQSDREPKAPGEDQEIVTKISHTDLAQPINAPQVLQVPHTVPLDFDNLGPSPDMIYCETLASEQMALLSGSNAYLESSAHVMSVPEFHSSMDQYLDFGYESGYISSFPNPGAASDISSQTYQASLPQEVSDIKTLSKRVRENEAMASKQAAKITALEKKVQQLEEIMDKVGVARTTGGWQ